jgi:hypothetical protein
MYDIFFIADRDDVDNQWNELRTRFPRAQRIDKPTNLDEIKKRSLTKFFYVVWDDIEISQDFNFDYRIPTWDEQYIHIFKNEKYYDGVCIFSKNHSISEREFKNRFFFGKKEIDILASVSRPLDFDIFFISYQESNADENWENLKSKFPRVKRIHGIKGIHQAHLAAATAAATEMFYVVDGDAKISNEFNFNHYIPRYERDVVYVWQSKNPINDLVYGYGGVKLLPTEKTLYMPTDSVDMTLSISSKFRSMPIISNTTEFNTSPFDTWRSAFRECVKLASKPIDENYDEETDLRLQIWCVIGKERKYGIYALDGARAGREYGHRNIGNKEALRKINDFDWLKELYEQRAQNIHP